MTTPMINCAEYTILGNYIEDNIIYEFKDIEYTLEGVRQFCEIFSKNKEVDNWAYWAFIIYQTKFIDAKYKYSEWKELASFQKDMGR